MIGFLGLSHLGLVSAAAAAAKDRQVVGFDEDGARVEGIAAGRLPFVEPGLRELLTSIGDRVTFTSDPDLLRRCDLLYVAVDVPTSADDRSDTAPVEQLLEVACRAAPPGGAVVILSQVEPGFTRSRRTLVEQDGRTLSYQVETLVFGRAVQRALRPERFIVGCADPSAPLPRVLDEYLALFDCPTLVMRYESAELCKIAVNTFLVSSVSTTNMLAELCERTGADWTEIVPALRLDARIGQHAYLAPGLGVGGSNLSRDLATIDRLANESGTDASLTGTWRELSEHRRAWPLAVLHRLVLGRVVEPRIALWGLSYKENTQSIRNSPGVTLARTLATAGVEVAAYDPEAEPVEIGGGSFRRVGSALEACERADCLVVTTPWEEFGLIAPTEIATALAGKLVVDPYGALDARGCAAAGLVQARLGVPLPEDAAC